MSMRYRGSIMWATLPTVNTTSASGVWTLAQQMQYQGAGAWPIIRPPSWTATTSSLSFGQASTVTGDADGNVYCASGSYIGYIVVTKFGPTGTKLWQKSYFIGSAQQSSANVTDMVFLSNGNLVLYAYTYVPYFIAPFLVIISPSGTIVNKTTMAYGSGGFFTGGIAVDGSDNIYTNNWQTQSPRASVVTKLNSSLTKIWDNGVSIGASGGTIVVGNGPIAVNSSGSKVYAVNYNSGGTNLGYLYEYNSSGTITATNTFAVNGAAAIFLNGVAVDPSGNIYICGGTASNLFVAKLSSTYSPLWVLTVSVALANVSSSTNWYGKLTYTSSGDIYFVISGKSITRITSSGTVVYSRAIDGAAAPDPSGSGSIFLYSATGASAPAYARRWPADGDGLSIILFGGRYGIYGQGPSFSSSSLTVQSTSAGNVASGGSLADYGNIATADLTDTFTTTATTFPATSGSALFAVPGTYSWIAPSGVTSVSVLAIGGGGGGGGFTGGAGGGAGGLGYLNSYSVTPGTAYTVVVGAGGTGGGSPNGNGTAGGTSYFVNTSTVRGGGGGAGNSGNASGGSGGTSAGTVAAFGGPGGNGSGGGGGGGGAAGYTGTGGTGANGTYGGSGSSGSAGTGGGGGGGGGGYFFNYTYGCGTVEQDYTQGGTGGPVGMAGQGSNGAGGGASSAGGAGSQTTPYSFGGGGGGGGVYQTFYPCCGGVNTSYYNGGAGYGGAVRILWGTSRTFPSTNVGAP